MTKTRRRAQSPGPSVALASSGQRLYILWEAWAAVDFASHTGRPG